MRLNIDEGTDALVIRCDGRTFFPGADIHEFDQPPQEPLLPAVVNAIENSPKLIVAAIHGSALGGGLEVALACHVRVAASTAQFGLPEVKLGLLPGAGGTQRLPRLVGIEKALTMLVEGSTIDATEAMQYGLIDDIVDEAVLTASATALARRKLAEPLKRTGALAAPSIPKDLLDNYWAGRARKLKHQLAPVAIMRALRDGLALPLPDALALERNLFLELRGGEQSRALRYMFAAERETTQVPGIDSATPTLPITSVGVIGAGTMGVGIALTFLLAGFPVTLIEQQEPALERGVSNIRSNVERSVAGGRLAPVAAAKLLERLFFTLDFAALSSVDLVVEAAYEDIAVKQAIFQRLDGVTHRGCILATNTSYLDINQIAGHTSRPDHVLGLHFFSPAHIMRLLEVVRAASTSAEVLATALKLAKRIGKIPVVAGVCRGFIGNRMLAVRRRECDRMVLEGASPYLIDRVAEEFGFPMGPFRASDLAGLDLAWSAENSRGATVRERLCELGRRGQKTGAGYYDYDEQRRASASSVVQTIIRELATEMQITQRSWAERDILDRLLYPMIDEGRAILAEGIALRASDIDVVWVHGYGWPRWRGGPMYYAEHVGVHPTAVSAAVADRGTRLPHS